MVLSSCSPVTVPVSDITVSFSFAIGCLTSPRDASRNENEWVAEFERMSLLMSFFTMPAHGMADCQTVGPIFAAGVLSDQQLRRFILGRVAVLDSPKIRPEVLRVTLPEASLMLLLKRTTEKQLGRRSTVNYSKF